MHFILKYALMDHLLIGVDHTRNQSAYGFGMEYAKNFLAYGALGFRVNGFNIEDTKFNKRQKSYFLNGSYQTTNFFNHIRLTANAGYDAYYEHGTLGLGIDINMKNNISWLTFTEDLSLLGEYYPQVDKVEGISGEHDVYAFGIKSQTFGHHFELLLTNATTMDARTMALGSNSKDLHFGFNINRKF